MPPLTPAERQKALLQQEIAKLSGAISRHAKPTPTFHPYPTRGRIPSRGTPRGRGGTSRGRGRGGSYGLDLRAVNRSTVPSGPQTASSSGLATPLTGTNNGVKEDGEVSPPPIGENAVVIGTKGKEKASEEWVKKTSKTGNMSLMTVKKSNHLLATKPKPLPRQRKPRVPPSIQVLTSTSTSEGEAKRVVIDGVIFQFEQGGRKLTRIGDLNSPKGESSTAIGTPTRRSIDYGGEQFKRTKRGNLVSRKSSRRTEMAKKPCRYYTKTGRCERALTCPYLHLPDRLAICPRFLRSSCPHTSETCPLSHVPSPHNTPSCQHFQATSTCRNGSSCLYPHVKVAADAPVCEDFSREGWCDMPPGTCGKLHGWECGEFRESGVCKRGKGCGLRHVLRVKKGVVESEGTEEVVEGGFDDGGEFIGFGDHGDPPPVSDEESHSDSVSENDNDDDDDDDAQEELSESDDEEEGTDFIRMEDDDDDERLLTDPMETDDEDEALVLHDL